MEIDNSTAVRDQLRKDIYGANRVINCVVCHKSHNLRKYKSRFVVCGRDERFAFQKVFDPNLKKNIITNGAVCDALYNKFRYMTKKRKAEEQVNFYFLVDLNLNSFDSSK